LLLEARPGLGDKALQKILAREGGRTLRRLRRSSVQVVEVPKKAEHVIARALRRNPHIQSVELDVEILPDEVIPNDPKYASAWHLQKIQAPGAWDSAAGEGVVVAVLDSGVDPVHLDLAPNLLPGWNVVSNSPDTSDINGHGTQVAGVVAALSNNALGVTSVAWKARILPIRVSDSSDGSAWTSDLAEGIAYAADHGARVANLSYGASGSSAVATAAQYMRSKGGVVFVSAGNSSNDPGYAANPYVVSISATGKSDARTSWSSYGQYVDFAAPGDSIWTTARGDAYKAVSGTSFSSPMTAAVAALVLAANKDLGPAEVEAILQNSADDLGAPGWDPYYGFGRINASRAVELAGGSAPVDRAPPVVSIASPSAGGTVEGIVPVDANASDDVGVARVDLFVNGAMLATDVTVPFGFSWDSSTLPAGSKATLLARAYDAAGNVASSPEVSVTVRGAVDATPPEVAITSPSDGATFSSTVTLSAYGSDEDKLASVKIYADGKLKCTGAPSVACPWTVRRDGAHTVKAVATDAAGNQSSTSITVHRVSKK
jgi:subtilisin family serine protease